MQPSSWPSSNESQSAPPIGSRGTGCPLFFPFSPPVAPSALSITWEEKLGLNQGTSWGPFSLSQSPGRMTNWDASLDLKSVFSLSLVFCPPTCCHGGGFPSLFLLINSNSSHATGKTHTHTHSHTRSHGNPRKRGTFRGPAISNFLNPGGTWQTICRMDRDVIVLTCVVLQPHDFLRDTYSAYYSRPLRHNRTATGALSLKVERPTLDAYS